MLSMSSYSQTQRLTVTLLSAAKLADLEKQLTFVPVIISHSTRNCRVRGRCSGTAADIDGALTMSESEESDSELIVVKATVAAHKSASNDKQAAGKPKAGPESGTGASKQRQDHQKQSSTTNTVTREHRDSNSGESESMSMQATVTTDKSAYSKKRAARKRKAGPEPGSAAKRGR